MCIGGKVQHTTPVADLELKRKLNGKLFFPIKYIRNGNWFYIEIFNLICCLWQCRVST